MKIYKLYSTHNTEKSAKAMLKMLKEQTTKAVLGANIEDDKQRGCWCLWLRTS